MIATFVKTLTDWRGDARLYELSRPVKFGDHFDASFVVVSATYIPFIDRYETYIFPTTAEGSVLSWSELDGSFNGAADHARALRGLGFEPRKVLQ